MSEMTNVNTTDALAVFDYLIDLAESTMKHMAETDSPRMSPALNESMYKDAQNRKFWLETIRHRVEHGHVVIVRGGAS